VHGYKEYLVYTRFNVHVLWIASSFTNDLHIIIPWYMLFLWGNSSRTWCTNKCWRTCLTGKTDLMVYVICPQKRTNFKCLHQCTTIETVDWFKILAKKKWRKWNKQNAVTRNELCFNNHVGHV